MVIGGSILFALGVVLIQSDNNALGGIIDKIKNRGLQQKVLGESEKTDTSSQNTALVNILAGDDKDNDGLTNTEEEQYGTMPDNPDTDGDGYSDGQEISAGYDPLKPSTSDSSTDEKATTEENTESEITNRTKDFLEENGYSEDNLRRIQNAIESPDEIDYELPEIPDSEMKITDQSGKQAIKDYLQTTLGITSRNNYFSDQQGLEQMLTQSFSSDTSQIQPIKTTFQGTYDDLRVVQVPSDAVSTHRQIMSIVSGIIEVLDQLDSSNKSENISVYTDPYLKFAKIIKKTVETGQNISRLAENNGVDINTLSL